MKRTRILIQTLFFLLSLSSAASASPTCQLSLVTCHLNTPKNVRDSKPTESRPRVGLALGGGGAKGAAEVGVLKVLEEEGIPIDYIVGTSIGSIVGGLYSIGYRADTLRSLFHHADWGILLSDATPRMAGGYAARQSSETYIVQTPMPFISGKKKKRKSKSSPLSKGLIAGTNIQDFLSSLTTGYHRTTNFESLPIPFKCVAVDLVRGNEIHLSRGSLAKAMRASMSIPGVFEPVEWDDYMLVDGGTLNNFPVDVVRDMGADIVIGVDLSQGGAESKDELKGFNSVLNQITLIMGQQKYERNRTAADLYINPRLNYGPMAFSQTAIDEMYAAGYATADSLRLQIRALKKQLGLVDEAPAVAAMPASAALFSVDAIRFDGANAASPEWLLKRIGLTAPTQVSLAQIEQAVERLRALGIFSEVGFTLSESLPYTLTFHLEENDYQQINVGARFDSKDIAGVLVNMSNLTQFGTRSHYSLTARLSKNYYLQGQYFFGSLFGPQLGLSYRFRRGDFNRFGEHEKEEAIEFNRHTFELFYRQAFLDAQIRVGAQADLLTNVESLSTDVGTSLWNDGKTHYINYFLQLDWDTYDRTYYPSRGWQASVSSTLYTDNGIEIDGRAPLCAVSLRASTVVRLTSRLALLPELKGRLLFGEETPAAYANYVGTPFRAYHLPQQIAWETSPHLTILRDKLIAAKVGLRYRMKQKIYFSAVGEYGTHADEFSDLFAHGNIWGLAARASYDFMLGPIGLQANYSNLYHKLTWFLNAGFYF